MSLPDAPTEPTLSQIFAADPYSLTRDGPEITAMVAHLRKMRAQFTAADLPGARAPSTKAKAPRKTKEEISDALKNLDLPLDDL